MNKALCLLVCFSILTACSKANVDGDVFVVKGDGSVVPSSGRTVYLLPYNTELEFIHGIANESNANTIEKVKADLLKHCPTAQEQTKELIAKIGEDVSAIEAAERIPAGGCEGLDANVVSLSNKLATIKRGHQDKVRELEASVAAMKAKKSAAIRIKADELEQIELDKIHTSLMPQDGYRVTYMIQNGSDYCIKDPLAFAFYANDEMVESGHESGFLKDDLGFSIPCLVLAGDEEKIVSIDMISANQSEVRRANAQGVYEVVKERLGAGSLFPRVTSVKLEPKLVELNKSETTKKIVYTKRAVNWEQKAQENFDFSDYDPAIEMAEAALEEENRLYMRDNSVAELSAKESALLVCNTDLGDLARLRTRKNKLQAVQSGLLACEQPSAVAADLLDALTTLNAEFGGEFVLPNYTESLTLNLAIAVAGAFESGSIIKAETNIHGAYSIPGVSEGKYLFFSEYADDFVNGFWLFPIIIDGDNRVDLNMSQFFPHRFSDYLAIQVDFMCKSCPLEQAELVSRSTADLLL